MVDILIFIALVSLLFAKIILRLSLSISLMVAMGIHASFLALCLWCLAMSPSYYFYAIEFSPANLASVSDPGRVVSISGNPVGNLGGALSRLMEDADLKVELNIGKDFTRPRNASTKRPFWVPLDSYRLEEASGGLSFFPRRPIFRYPDIAISSQSENCNYAAPLRMMMIGDERVNGIHEVLPIIAELPVSEFIRLRLMCSTPDNAVASVFFNRRMIEGAKTLQSYFGFVGLPVRLRFANRQDYASTLIRANEHNVFALEPIESALKSYENDPKKGFAFTFINGENYLASPENNLLELEVLPRMAMLPWLHLNPLISFLLGMPGSFLRQILSLPTLCHLPVLWSYWANQHYALDDGFFWSFIFFRTSEFGMSCVLGILLLMLSDKFFASRIEICGPRIRPLILWSFIFLFHTASLLVMHRYFLK